MKKYIVTFILLLLVSSGDVFAQQTTRLIAQNGAFQSTPFNSSFSSGNISTPSFNSQPSDSYTFGQKAAPIIAFILMIVIPILFIFCLIRSFKTKKTFWIIFSVLSGLITIPQLIFFSYSLVLGFQKGFQLAQQKRQLNSLNSGETSGRVNGSDYDYTIELPNSERWSMSRRINGIDLLAGYRDVYFGVTIERISMGNSEDVLQHVMQLIRSKDPTASYSTPETVVIDGLPWLHTIVTAKVQNINFTYSYYIYSGPNGTYKLYGYTGSSIFPQEESKINKIAKSWIMGSKMKSNINISDSSNPTASTAVETIVPGTDYDYSIKIPDPNKWLVYRRTTSSDLTVAYHDVLISVSVQRIDSGSNQDLYQLIKNRIRHFDPESTIDDPTIVTIDGTQWLHFLSKSKVNNISFTYSYYIHSGAEGTFEIVGYTGSNIFNDERNSIEKISTSFTFGNQIKEIIKKASSQPTPTPIIEKKKPATVPQSVVPIAA